ncbi:MAG: DUF6314 family protein [Streptosporangiaceae bacterium]
MPPGEQPPGGPERPRAGPLPPVPVGDTLAFLLGRWLLERQLVDHRAGMAGQFTGTAEFAPPDQGQPELGHFGLAQPELGGPELAYREHGQLRFGDYAGPASRALRCLPRADGSAEIRFEDGRAFYHLDLRAGRWQARHDCGPDVYQVTFEVLGSGLVTEHWHVTGPAKDYHSRTTLRRTDGLP